MPDLFATNSGKSEDASDPYRPLAERLRPTSLEEIIGQDHLLGEGGPLEEMLAQKRLPSIVFWGPPGVGKTTLARLIAKDIGFHFEQISAIFSGMGELRKIFDAAGLRFQNAQRTLLFVDEIHRFNKAQQDSFLPHVESGQITLIGATTENPSFELNSALLSRASVLVLNRLDEAALALVLGRAESYLGGPLPLTGEARAQLIASADGDARSLIGLVEQLHREGDRSEIDIETLSRRVSKRMPKYDKSDDEHYNLISALHKSVRGSDPDASLYWLARMLNAGEDPRYLARRITRMAIEDVGLADPQAQRQCLDAWETYERIGSPEGELALAQAVIYLALSPKSNAGYKAFKAALSSARSSGSLPPPKHILNAPTQLMKDEGYGAGYAYDHDRDEAFSGQHYFPDRMDRLSFYAPVARGFERELTKRLAYFANLRSKRGSDGDADET